MSILRGKRRWILFGLGAVFLVSAALIFLLAERWTFYTPYSAETSWGYFLPGGMHFSMAPWIGILVISTLVVFGTGLLVASTAMLPIDEPPTK